MALVTGGASGGGGVGSASLIYRFTVAGAAKTSIDTTVDTPEAGTNVWTNGDLLEIWLYARTDEATANSTLNWTFNNDTGANYDRQSVTGVTTVASASQTAGATAMLTVCPGASAAANNFGSICGTCPNFAGTVGHKTLTFLDAIIDATAGTNRVDMWGHKWRSTSAITRLAVTPATGGAKLLIGSQLLVYKRLAS